MPDPEKPFWATPNAVAIFTRKVIDRCLQELQERARQSTGLIYIAVVDSDVRNDNLWFVEDNGEGAITRGRVSYNLGVPYSPTQRVARAVRV